MSTLNALFGFALVIAIMLVGMDFLAGSAGAGVQRQYRRIVTTSLRFVRRQASAFVRFSWRRYRQFIIGTGFGVFATLYFLGRLG